jgi:hypothetical protein
LKQECVIGAINMLGLTKRLHARILQGSRSEVYGEQPEGYGRPKTLFYDFGRQHGPPVGVARILSTYGLNLHPQEGSVVSRFIAQGLKIEPIILNGSASQTRSFVDDTIHGLTRLYKCRVRHEWGSESWGSCEDLILRAGRFCHLKQLLHRSFKVHLKRKVVQDDRLLPSPGEANKLMWGQI